MEWYHYAGIIVTVGGFVGFIYWLKFGDTSAHYHDLEYVMLGIDKTFRQFKKNTKTPGGALVKSTTTDLPASALADIDAGLRSQIDRYARVFPHWDLHRNISDYEIHLIDPMGINEVTEPGSPCIFAQGFQTAGTCLGTYPRTNIKRPVIVVTHQANQQWRFRDYFRNSITNESEHVKEWKHTAYKPENLFWVFATSGDVHPHEIEPWGESVPRAFGFKSATNENAVCVFECDEKF
jgi:hypothetical protein